MSQQSIKVVYGTAGALFTDENAPEIYKILEENGCKNVDTAQLYEGKEAVIGRTGGAKRFIVDTKEFGGFKAKMATKDGIVKRGQESMEKLATDQVDIFYIHAPEREIPLEDTLSGMNELYKQDKFKRFGLSNYKPEEVEEVVKVCKDHGFVAPTVYQGNYSPVARRQDTELFPVLRRHGIAFYAYSPLAGGFLTKTKEDIESKSKGRFTDSGAGPMYMALYNKPTYLQALATWNEIAQKHDVGKAEMAYRWVAFNSPLRNQYGDAIIIGASRIEQLKESLAWFQKGPLPDSAAQGIEKVWESVKDEAGLDNFNLNN